MQILGHHYEHPTTLEVEKYVMNLCRTYLGTVIASPPRGRRDPFFSILRWIAMSPSAPRNDACGVARSLHIFTFKGWLNSLSDNGMCGLR